MRLIVATFLLLLILFSCKKTEVSEIETVQEETTHLSNTPEIEVLQVTPLQVKQYTDSIVFSIKYTDGDGDLGSADANVRNAFITDSRNDVTYSFRIPLLAPQEEQVAITGTLNFVINNTVIFDSSSSQTVEYAIFVTDRSANASNVVYSPIITITE